MIWQLILVQVITFIGIILVLRLLFYQQLRAALKRLQDLHRQNLEKEVELIKELERAKQDRQMEIQKGKEEAKKLRESALQEIAKVKDQLDLESRNQAEAVLKEARFDCELLKHEAAKEIEESGIRLALDLIREIFSEKAKQTLEIELVDELIEDLRNIDKEKLKVELKKAEITSNYPLLDAQKETIAKILQDAIGCQIELDEKTDPSIISGLVINLSGLVLDGSLKTKLQKLIPYLKTAK